LTTQFLNTFLFPVPEDHYTYGASQHLTSQKGSVG